MNRRGSRNGGPSAGNAHKVSGRTETKPPPRAEENGTPAQAGVPLTKAEKGRLQQFETAIGSGLASFVQVGHALSHINAGRLYREVSDTFEDYCEQRWDLTRQHGYRLIKAAECYDLLKSKLLKGTRLPLNESQVRPLVENLKHGQWVKAWKQVIADTSGVRLTAEAVEKVVRGLGGKSSHPKPERRKNASQNVPSKAIAKLLKPADRVLRKDRPTVAELRRVLAQLRDELKQLCKGTAS